MTTGFAGPLGPGRVGLLCGASGGAGGFGTSAGSRPGPGRVAAGPAVCLHRAPGTILAGVNLPLAWSVVLIVTAGWNLLIWPRFWQRIVADPRSRDDAGHRTRFLTVHAVLIAVSLALGLAVGVLGVLTLV